MPSDIFAELERARAERDLSVFDLTSIDELSDQDVRLILDLAALFEKSKTRKTDFLKGISIVNAFFENSTRTRLSFELAGKHLGADTVNISASESSAKKGESYLDTIQTLCALGNQIIVIRVSQSGIPHFLKQYSPASIVNAGDGWHEHPSQGLLDAKTMLDHHGTMEGKIITVIGDILHSRVFGSLVRISRHLGAEVRVSCPETFLPKGIEQFGATYIPNVDDAIHGTDVVYALRVQEERGASGDIPNLREYSKTYGITRKRFELANRNAILMHPGPVIRDTDVNSELMSHERCHILKQVENGLAVRKAILWLLGNRRDGKKKEYIKA